MSIVSDFAAAMHTQAAAMIGAESVVIGSTTLSCVLAEMDDGKDFATGGFEVSKRLTAVCRTADLPAASILKKTATARGITFRVDAVRSGATFATIEMTEASKA